MVGQPGSMYSLQFPTRYLWCHFSATDLKVSETTIDGSTNYSEFLPFGTFDKDGKSERLLKIAIGVLDGTYPPKDDETPEESTTQTRFKVEKSVSSPASRRFSSKGLRL